MLEMGMTMKIVVVILTLKANRPLLCTPLLVVFFAKHRVLVDSDS